MALLGVPANYTKLDVHKAFRRKAKHYHPDVGGRDREQGCACGHAGDHHLPRRQTDFLALAVMVGEHLVDVGDLLAKIDFGVNPYKANGTRIRARHRGGSG
jgi:hypothetical protein